MTTQTLIPDATSTPRRTGAVVTSLRELLRSRHTAPASRALAAARRSADRAARRAVAREIASYPATRGAVAVLPAARRTAA